VAGAGVDLLRKFGGQVEAGEALYRVHAAYPADLGFARQEAREHDGVRLGSPADVPPLYLEI